MAALHAADLHTHTLHSDGALTPEALIDLGARRGLAAMAVTDHDTLGGLESAQRAGAVRGVEVIPGIELSVFEAGSEVHLLGYFISRPAVLASRLADLDLERQRRAQHMVDRLVALGAPVEYAAVRARARGVVGRPHVAEELVAQGHVGSLNEAFDRYLATGRPAYVQKQTLGLAAAAALLREAGAVPVVAHPGVSAIDPLLPGLRDAGVVGLEVWHPKHDAAAARRYLRLARRYGLLPTGGSDFHREIPGGLLPGDVHVSLEIVAALREHAA